MWVSTHLLDLPQGTQTPIPPDNSADPQFAPATIILSLAGAKTMTFAPAIFMSKCVGRREAQGRSEQSDPGELEGIRHMCILGSAQTCRYDRLFRKARTLDLR